MRAKQRTHESEPESASLRLLGGASCALALLLRASVAMIAIAVRGEALSEKHRAQLEDGASCQALCVWDAWDALLRASEYSTRCDVIPVKCGAQAGLRSRFRLRESTRSEVFLALCFFQTAESSA